MHPAFVHLANETYPERRCRVLLAWQGTTLPRLAGVWAFAVGRPPRSIIPISVLIAPAVPNAYLSAPVVARDCLEDVLVAMLDHLDTAEHVPSIVALDTMRADTATMQALIRVLERRGSPMRIFTRSMRPLLDSNLDGKAYLEQALSSSSRKKLRQHRRRLAEKGSLQSAVLTEPQAVRNAFEDFLTLEAAGWKGQQGTALLNKPSDARFARAMIAALSERGDAAIHQLTLDARPVSMQVVLHAGPAAFTWKTTYAEALHDFSPGMLLLEDYTTALLADRRVSYVDSCAFDDSGYMATWKERAAIAGLWFSVRRGRSRRFSLMAQLQANYLALRERAKALHHDRKQRNTHASK
jgi:CelD/BcsL family acetyltransferase involved in cellulose biosynthesis